jgi:S1-C subfamily serine protease
MAKTVVHVLAPVSCYEPALKTMLKSLLWAARLGILGTSAMAVLVPGLAPVVAQSQATGLISQANLQASINAYFQRGNDAQVRGDYQGAIESFGQVLRLNPKHAPSYVNRGLARESLGDFQSAIADYNQALRLNPNNSTAYRLRGSAREMLKDYHGAIADYDQVLRLDPGNIPARDGRGRTRNILNNSVAAQPTTAPTPRPQPATYLPTPVSGPSPKPVARPQPTPAPVSAVPPPTPAPAPPPSPPPTPAPSKTAPVAAPTSAPTTTTTPTTPVAANSTPVNVFKIANQTTVLIDGQNPGSGVIISRTGNTYYVLTAKHVVATKDEYTVVTPGGKKFPIDYTQVKQLANLDLAIVQFTSSESFSVAQLGNSEQVSQGDSIFVSGWLSMGDGPNNNSQQVTDGRVTGFRRGDATGYELAYSSPTGGGMSGGPVFDTRGQVIGIHGLAATNQQGGKIGINLGIPINLFLRQAPQAGLNLQQLGLKSQL